MHMHHPLESHKFYLLLHHPIHVASHLYTRARRDDRERHVDELEHLLEKERKVDL